MSETCSEMLLPLHGFNLTNRRYALCIMHYDVRIPAHK